MNNTLYKRCEGSCLIVAQFDCWGKPRGIRPMWRNIPGMRLPFFGGRDFNPTIAYVTCPERPQQTLYIDLLGFRADETSPTALWRSWKKSSFAVIVAIQRWVGRLSFNV